LERIGGRASALAAFAFVLVASLAIAGGASASPPDLVLQIPEAKETPGSGAAELNNPRAIAGNPSTGHIYVADSGNARVSEYTAWGLFVKSWGWGVANGAAELQTCGPVQPEAEPPPSLCQQGLSGEGKGQMEFLLGGIAVDGAGNVWVGDLENLRVQKFSPSGQFLLMAGGEVNKTKIEEGAPAEQQNVCPVAPGDVCQAGKAGSAPGYLTRTFGNYIDYSPTSNAIVVGDKDRIQLFELDGTFKEGIPFEGALEAFDEKAVDGLDVGPSGNIYLTLSGLEDAFKLSPAGVPLAPGKPGESKFEISGSLGVAVDVEGNVYAIDDPLGKEAANAPRIAKFDAAGKRLLPTEAEEEDESFFPYLPDQGLVLSGLATNFCAGSEAPGNLYLSFGNRVLGVTRVNAYGTAPVGCEPPPPRPPEVLAQFATSVGREEATVRALINPRFFQDANYYVEYGTGKCSEGGCPNKAPVSPAPLTSKSVNGGVRTAPLFLEGLEPSTTYRYRFVAESGFALPDSNGPVFGEDPDGKAGPAQASLEEGLERSFTTFAPAGKKPICPANEAFRVGAAAKLPDCRGFELVSPLEKEGGDAALWIGKASLVPHLYQLEQSAPSGEKFAFTSTTAFDEPQASPFASEYLASRTATGWSSESLMPPHTLSPVNVATLLSNEFHGFSENLCASWVKHFSVDPLTADGIAGFANLYRRENCAPPPLWEALTTAEPPHRDPEEYYELRVLGASADNTHAIFTANDELLPDAPNLNPFERLLYEHTPEGLRFVCYLPSGNPSPQACSAGTVAGTAGGNEASVRNAISDDGQTIFWSAYSGNPGAGPEPSIPGPIYARIGGAQTIEVSGAVAPDPAIYWTAAADGSKAIFEFASGEHEDELYEFDVEAKSAKLIAKGVLGPMGASEDASRIYFASTEDLDEGGLAAAGNRNLYLYEADLEGGPGAFTFVMELGPRDVSGNDVEPQPIDNTPAQRSAYLTPDGLRVAFTSSVSPTPTGYDNLDAASDEPNQEVYLYDAEEDALRCVSCNPSGARPEGEDIGNLATVFLVAARIQGWESLMHSPRVVSADGSRVYYESHDALVPEDTNGGWDVYQWEKPGAGTCNEGSASFDSVSGGCIDLISSGQSPFDATFLDADPTGQNVFISTQSSLVGADYGLNDVYDARVNGGFPEQQPKPPCEGEACQSPPPPPPNPTGASESLRGQGNVKPRKRCKAGTRKVRRKGKGVCIRKRKHPKGRRAGR
jgi:DNA-binding beta-propeller fold protein YncE